MHWIIKKDLQYTYSYILGSLIFIYIYIVSQKIDIILKAIILKTTKSSSTKLNSSGVKHHKFILAPISEGFILSPTCETTLVKLVVKLLPNTL